MTSLADDTDDLRVIVQFTTLHHLGRGAHTCHHSEVRVMGFEEIVEPVDGCSLGVTGVTMLHSREVVRNEEPTGFTINAKAVLFTTLVFGFDARVLEGKVNGQTLMKLLEWPCELSWGRQVLWSVWHTCKWDTCQEPGACV